MGGEKRLVKIGTLIALLGVPAGFSLAISGFKLLQR